MNYHKNKFLTKNNYVIITIYERRCFNESKKR